MAQLNRMRPDSPHFRGIFAGGAALLALALVGCTTPQRNVAIAASDPGRLSSAEWVVNVPGLRPCNDGAETTLRLDQSQPVNILVHGCNGSTGKFRALAEVLAFHGQQSACFDYDDRDSLMVSSGQLAEAVDTLAQDLDTPQVATLFLNDLACWFVSGDKWYEITHASDFIQQPGVLAPQVSRHLKVVTDERGSCRRRDVTGRCLQSDYIFSLAEQRYPPVTESPLTTDIEVVAGHVEIVGESGVTPYKLIAVFQHEGILRATPPERQAAFQDLLTQLY